MISIITVNYGRPDLVISFLHSVCRSADLSMISEVIIVDNGYPQKGDSRNVIDSAVFPVTVRFVQNAGSSFASGVNQGAALATGEGLIIANNDVELLPGYSIKPLADYLRKEPSAGVVGPQLVYPDGSWQRSYGRYPSLREAMISLAVLEPMWNGIRRLLFRHGWRVSRAREVDYIDGAFMVVRKTCFAALGGFDESYDFYAEDADFCWRARRSGWGVVYLPDARVLHLRGASSAMEVIGDYAVRLLRAKEKFVEQHQGVSRVKWYKRLQRASLYERRCLYGLAFWLFRSPEWRWRAMRARVSYQCVKAGY